MSETEEKSAADAPTEETEPEKPTAEAEQKPKSPEATKEAKETPADTNDDDPLVIDEAGDTESEEKEFEPTIDMMMNDFDDERTMEEEEALNDEQDEDEVSALEQEGDMPLEELLKLYNYGGAGPPGATSAGNDVPSNAATAAAAPTDDKKNEEVKKPAEKKEEEKKEVEKRTRESDEDDSEKKKDEEPPNKKNRSELARFYEAAVEGRALRSQAVGGPVEGGPEVEEEESDNGGEESDEGRDYSWKKTIMIGPSCQASVPSGMSSYGDTLPYENEDKLLWNPYSVPEKDAEDFLAKSQESLQTNQGISSLPLGAHVRDDEQALFLLLRCGYNSEEALRRRRMSSVPPADTMSLWSEEECRAFELGLRLYGKDFHMIQQQKVRTRSVGELVQFYYLWKKTERHDVFATATRLEKKKCALHPGTTDYMDRFIDEQDRDIGLDWSSPSSNYNSLLFDTRKGMSLNTGKSSENGDAILSSNPTATSSSDPSILATGNGSSVQSVPTSTAGPEDPTPT